MLESQAEAKIETVLVATDFGARSARAEAAAESMAASFDARLVLVHAIEPIEQDDEAHEGDDEVESFYQELQQKAERELQARVSDLDDRGILAEYYIAVGHAWQVILEQAEESEVDLIVTGRRQYKDRESITLGTTGQKIYFGTSRPVLLVPQED